MFKRQIFKRHHYDLVVKGGNIKKISRIYFAYSVSNGEDEI
jgi:hypothetical protein